MPNPLKTYSKAKSGGFYGCMNMLYRLDELDNLPAEILLEALQAEGVNMSHRGYELTHRLKLFAEGFGIYARV